MTKDEAKAAFERRQTQLAQAVKASYAQTMEAWLRSVPQTREMMTAMGKLLVDNGALFLTQLNVPREEFLAWATESYELYTHIVSETRAALGLERAEDIGPQAAGIAREIARGLLSDELQAELAPVKDSNKN
jgi:hypothetical protein